MYLKGLSSEIKLNDDIKVVKAEKMAVKILEILLYILHNLA
jgi:hypothetical protein